MSASNAKAPVALTRQWPRVSHLKDVSLSIEGRSEVLSIHLPNISLSGMFLNITTSFPEGTILKVRFRLSRSNHLVDVRCEVRYCLPGVGVGLEFVDIKPADKKAIMKELVPQVGRRKRAK